MCCTLYRFAGLSLLKLHITAESDTWAFRAATCTAANVGSVHAVRVRGLSRGCYCRCRTCRFTEVPRRHRRRNRRRSTWRPTAVLIRAGWCYLPFVQPEQSVSWALPWLAWLRSCWLGSHIALLRYLYSYSGVCPCHTATTCTQDGPRRYAPHRWVPHLCSSFTGILPLLRPLMLLHLFETLPYVGATHATGAKRAYNRAVRRAAAHPQQGTYYRGRWHCLSHFHARVLSPQTSKLVRRDLPQSARLHVATYNAGGLPTEAYHELLLKLREMPRSTRPSVVHVQETHWKSDLEYQTEGWLVISSASPSPMAGGLITQVNTDHYSPDQVAFSAPIPGRLLHTRIQVGETAVDSVNLYQKVLHTSLSRQEQGQKLTPAAQRKAVWQALHTLLLNIPRRHLLVLAGDFNSPPPLVRGQVGSRADKFRSPSVADLRCLENLIQDLDLILLNSWTRSAAATFGSEQGRTLIDHVYVRRNKADVVARQSCPHDWSLAAWRGGGKHWAVTACIPFPSCRSLQKAKFARLLIDLECLRKVCRDPTHPGILRLREAASDWVHSHPYGSVTPLNNCLLDQVRALFPARRQQGRVVPWTQPAVTLSVRAMWEAYHQWRYRAQHGKRGLFDAWRCYSHFRRAHQAFRRQSRQAKKQWFTAKVLEMEQASAAGDIRTLFRLTGTLMPKQPKRRLQLRGPQGEVWTTRQQLACLRSFYQDLYAPSDEPTLHSVPQKPSNVLPHSPLGRLFLHSSLQLLSSVLVQMFLQDG